MLVVPDTIYEDIPITQICPPELTEEINTLINGTFYIARILNKVCIVEVVSFCLLQPLHSYKAYFVFYLSFKEQSRFVYIALYINFLFICDSIVD